MGKKKIKERRPYEGEVSQEKSIQKGSQKKTYSYQKDTKHGRREPDADDNSTKVQIQPEKEEAILALIQESKGNKKMTGSASKRITNKKLKDLYETLQRAGFKHSQIEQSMTNTVVYGGDLIDALDWLCLFTPNDQLPEGFSQTLEQEEQRVRPKFDKGSQAQGGQIHSPHDATQINAPINAVSSFAKNEGDEEVFDEDDDNGADVKDWIMRYAEQSDDDEKLSQSSSEADPNEQYLGLFAKLEDLKQQAAEAKERKDYSANKKLSQQIRTVINELNQVEQHPLFDSRMKIEVPSKQEQVKSDPQDSKPKDAKETTEQDLASDQTQQGEEGASAMEGFSIFEESAQTEAKKPKATKETKPSAPLDKRCFEYTRKQWTGKSPKQFLIDWVRKNLPKSPPPSYQKVHVRGNLWRSRCKVQRQKEEDLMVVPDIVCENLKEAEHLASTLALYQLCKGQSVYTLLPPSYRDVWLEWKDTENKIKDAQKEKENKPRDMFVTKLLKKLKVTDEDESNDAGSAKGGSSPTEDVEESWEDIAETDESKDSYSSQATPKVKARQHKPVKTFTKEEIKSILLRNQETENFKELLLKRKELPVFQYRDQVMSAIMRENVVVIAGETGSGKSTQVPHFVLEEVVKASNGFSGSIVCTEPRRISTISLANRVSEELGEQGPGTPDSLCGYQIRFESRRTDSTRLTYCTTGVLLRKLQQDPRLNDVSCVIVDEVHERSVQSDFLLVILRQLLQTRSNLKVILMSATVDASKFSSYFQHCPVVNIPGRTFPVEVFHLEDAIEQTQFKLEEDSSYSRRYEDIVREESAKVSVTSKGGDSHQMEVSWTKDDIYKIDKSGLSAADYFLSTRNIITRMHTDRINMDLIMTLLSWFDTSPEYRDVEGAVLVFMPGFSHIQELYDLIMTDKKFANKKRYRVIPLHSVLSSKDQSQAFNVPPKGVRKIVISTNIAETGITIPDAVFVVDTGKVKENRYIESSQMSTLEEVWTSKASAKQRQGRAGRVRPGFCFRLYTKTRFDSMRQYSVPEILRVPLEELCLHIMKCELGDPAAFLAQAVDPPPPGSISRAMNVLREVGACFSGETRLTPLGQHLAALPVNVRVGKMLVYGAMLGCLYPVCIIGAAMTDKSPFMMPLGKRDQVQIAKLSLAHANSDQLTLLKAFIGWKDAQQRGYEAEIQYCNKYFLKRANLLEIQNVSNDLQKLVNSIGFDSVDAIGILKRSKATKKLVSSTGVLNISQADGLNSLSADLLSQGMSAILKAVLTAGLYPNVTKISYEAKVDAAANPEQHICQGQTTQGHVAVHPSSVNRNLTANGFLVYHEKVRSTRIYIRDCSQVSAYPLLLFGGDICVQHKDKAVNLDEWIQFKAFAKTGVIFKELREILDNVLERKLYDPTLDLKEEPVIPILLELLATER